MNIILLERIVNIGNIGETVTVKPGYARNYLIPQGKAIFATTKNLKKFELKRNELEKVESERQLQAKEKFEKLQKLSILEKECHANDEGQLYGALSTADIAELIVQQGIEVEKKQISFPKGVMKVLGEHSVVVNLYENMEVELTINIIAEKKEIT